MALLTADWSQFGENEFFRRFDIYDMEWFGEVNLETTTLATTMYGGPIAAIRDKNKLVRIKGSGRPVITVYTTSGKVISSFTWNSGQIVQLGWSLSCDLLCVQEDAKVLIYDLNGDCQYYFSLGQEAQDSKVLAAQIFQTAYGTGVAVLTKFHRIFIVNTIAEKEAKHYRLPDPKESSPPTAWLAFSLDRRSRVLYAVQKDLCLLVEGESKPYQLALNLGDDQGEIVLLAISSCHDCLAIFTNKGKLWLGTLDTLNCYRLYDTRSSEIPNQLLWCGNDAVVFNYEHLVVVVGIRDECITYQYDCPTFLVQEIDCVRLITSGFQEIFQRVPQVVRDVFKINSTAPGSYLLEASKQFLRGSHQANEYLHLVKEELHKAVCECIDAAGHEFKIETQEMLIKAAQFGKTFLDDFNSFTYVEMIKLLPCLNSVRDKKIGIPLTFKQYQKLTMSGLLDLLICHRQYFLALQIAKYLKLPDHVKVLAQWACYKVKQNLSKDQIAQEISEKLKGVKGISYTAIAKKASEAGKMELAIKLIEYEPCAMLQVPLLLKLRDYNVALQKALDSGNTDLVYYVLQNYQLDIGVPSFQIKIRNYPVAHALYLKYCKEHNLEALRSILRQEDDHIAQAELSIQECFDPEKDAFKEASLSTALDCYKKAKHEFFHTLCQDQLKLLKYQKSCEKFTSNFVGESLHNTLKKLLNLDEVKMADKLRTEYKVPDRRYWWLRVESMAERNNWTSLESFSKSKKSPIGYEPFFDVCWDNGQKREAEKYFSKIKEELKVKYLIKMERMEEAAQLAFHQSDREALEFIQKKCAPNLSAKIGGLIHQLSKK